MTAIKILITFILIILASLIGVRNVIACSSIIPSPADVCIAENYNPKSDQFKSCMFDLMDMDHIAYLMKYDPCMGGAILRLPISHTQEIENIIFKIVKEYSSKNEITDRKVSPVQVGGFPLLED